MEQFKQKVAAVWAGTCRVVKARLFAALAMGVA